ncbi:hypothetical protein B0T17DRAFT_527037 [Bombardia bombarda]|uniref:DNA-directed RNA polymerases I, II, and III subunit RPABC3 n=1 Tax=Bombardia bombarda TaxID=252184 RepID=A0AA40CA79_9PEZI|nr:hypothetical protein B0T17DRAFT_527037 [Bombardia bombarda]
MSGIATDANLFQDDFKVNKLSDKKYDRVDRLFCSSLDEKTTMSLDINNELFPCAVGDQLHVVIATSLALDGSKDDERGWRDIAKAGGGEATLADTYDYVCHGKIYKFVDGTDGQTIKAYTSFGGLLMELEGPYKKLTPLRVDYVYLLVKKN